MALLTNASDILTFPRHAILAGGRTLTLTVRRSQTVIFVSEFKFNSLVKMHSLRLFWEVNNEAALQRRHTRINRRKLEQIENIPDLEFVHRFRLDKQTFWSLCDDLRHLTSLKGTREISLQLKVRFVLLTLG